MTTSGFVLIVVNADDDLKRWFSQQCAVKVVEKGFEVPQS